MKFDAAGNPIEQGIGSPEHNRRMAAGSAPIAVVAPPMHSHSLPEQVVLIAADGTMPAEVVAQSELIDYALACGSLTAAQWNDLDEGLREKILVAASDTMRAKRLFERLDVNVREGTARAQ